MDVHVIYTEKGNIFYSELKLSSYQPKKNTYKFPGKYQAETKLKVLLYKRGLRTLFSKTLLPSWRMKSRTWKNSIQSKMLCRSEDNLIVMPFATYYDLKKKHSDMKCIAYYFLVIFIPVMMAIAKLYIFLNIVSSNLH